MISFKEKIAITFGIAFVSTLVMGSFGALLLGTLSFKIATVLIFFEAVAFAAFGVAVVWGYI